MTREKNYSKQVRFFIDECDKKLEYSKSLNYLTLRNGCSEEDFAKDIFTKKIEYAIYQIRNGEQRYILYFIYKEKRKGRAYVITFRNNKIIIRTIFPLGSKTLCKYDKKRFKYLRVFQLI